MHPKRLHRNCPLPPATCVRLATGHLCAPRRRVTRLTAVALGRSCAKRACSRLSQACRFRVGGNNPQPPAIAAAVLARPRPHRALRRLSGLATGEPASCFASARAWLFDYGINERRRLNGAISLRFIDFTGNRFCSYLIVNSWCLIFYTVTNLVALCSIVTRLFVSAGVCLDLSMGGVRFGVWSLVRRFDQPQQYKPFVSRCIMQGELNIGSLRQVNVKSGLPATTSTERLELLDDEEHILGIRIVGGDHRLKNYSSIITVHPEIIDGRPGTLVIESFVVDVPDGNTKDDTCYFVKALINCNLKSLADASERMAVQDRAGSINRA
ncbi:hypothetical protein U1Q18_023701 [Sarracenia purpurea var. burkii]